MQYRSEQCRTVQYNAVQEYSVQYRFSSLQSSTVNCSAVLLTAEGGSLAVICTPQGDCLCRVKSTVHSIHCVQYTLSTVCTVYSLYSIHCVQYTLCTVCTVYSLYSIHFVQYTLCTVYTVSSIQCLQYILCRQ